MDQPELENWESLYDEFAGRLLLFAKQFVGCAAAAEDVVQEGFVKFWKRREEHGVDSLESRLFGCVRWAALDWLRKSRRTRRREDLYGESEAVAVESRSFSRPIENQETADLLEAALKDLPREQREVVVLKVWGGLTLREIGDALDISPNTAASRFRYAVGSLKKNLKIVDYAEEL